MYQRWNFDRQFREGACGLQTETQRFAGEYCAQVYIILTLLGLLTF